MTFIKDSARSFELTSRAIASQFGVKVQISDVYQTAASAQTGDGRYVIVMPEDCLDKPSASGYLDHEAAHCRYTPFKRLQQWIESGVVTAPESYIRTWENVFEDMRIERLMSDDYPGCRRNLEALAHLLFNRDSGPAKEPPKYASATDALVKGLVSYSLWHLQEMRYGVAPASDGIWDAMDERLGGALPRADVDAILQRVEACTEYDDIELSVFDMIELVRRVYPDALQQQSQPGQQGQRGQQGRQQSQQSQRQGQGSGSDPSRCAGQEQSPDESSDDSSGDGQGSGGPESGDSGSTSQSDGKRKGKGKGKGKPTRSQRRSLEQDPSHQSLMQDMLLAGSELEDESDKGKRGFDSIERDPDGEPEADGSKTPVPDWKDGRKTLSSEMAHAGCSPTPATGLTASALESSWVHPAAVRSNVRGLTGPVLQALLQTRTVAVCRTGYSGRKLDTRRMTRACVGDGRIFATRGAAKGPDTEIVFLLDGSGSMSGTEIINACAVVYGMQDAVNNLKGFASQAFVYPNSNAGCLLTPLDGRRYPTATGSTPSAAAVMLAADRFSGLKRLNVIMLVTDGCPDNPYAFVEAVRRVRKRDIEVVVVGYGCDPASFVRTAEVKSFVAKDPKELAQRLREILADIVNKG